MKAVLFSHFPQDVFDNTLKPKFDQMGVEILRVISVDKGVSQKCEDADVLIAMIELMSAGQRDKVKAMAKKLGKPYVALYRKGAVWEKTLGRVVARFNEEQDAKKKPALSLVGKALPHPVLPANFAEFLEESPTSVETPPAYTLEEMQELLNQALEELDQVSSRASAIQDQFEEKGSLIEKLKLERNQMAAAFRRAEDTNQALEKGVAKLRGEHADLQKEFASWKVSNHQTEHGGALVQMQELVRKNRELQGKIERADQSLKLAHDEISVNKRKVAEAESVRASVYTRDERIKELEAQLGELLARLKEGEKFVDSAKIEIQKAYEESISSENLNRLLAEVRTREAAARKELETQKARNKNQEEELVRLRAQKPLPLVPPTAVVKKTEDFVEVRNAFKMLWRTGAMDEKEILQKLMAWEPKP